MIEVNKIYNENCLDTMARMPGEFIDLTVTSPPYDNLRTYNGYSFDFESIAKELFRVTKQGGIVVWVVGDATVNGSETGTSFKQALYFKEIGFNLHDTMIWNKDSFTAVGSLETRYAPVFEYMFILSKGAPQTFNPIKDRPNKHAKTTLHGTIRTRDGSMRSISTIGNLISEHGQRFNIWTVYPQRHQGEIKHPAVFPTDLAKDHILSWSNENDLVYDPFMGSGTTAKAAHLLKRNWIGSEISTEYVQLANKRLEPYLMQETLF
jgi:DNA modification methylase